MAISPKRYYNQIYKLKEGAWEPSLLVSGQVVKYLVRARSASCRGHVSAEREPFRNQPDAHVTCHHNTTTTPHVACTAASHHHHTDHAPPPVAHTDKPIGRETRGRRGTGGANEHARSPRPPRHHHGRPYEAPAAATPLHQTTNNTQEGVRTATTATSRR
jgi:hypothetical protein